MAENETGRTSGYPLLTVASTELSPDALMVAPRGEIDLATTDLVDRELRRAEKSHEVVILDLREVTFMDSTGLHLIIEAGERIRELGRRLVIVPGGRQIQRLLKLTGAADRIETIDDPSTASWRS